MKNIKSNYTTTSPNGIHSRERLKNGFRHSDLLKEIFEDELKDIYWPEKAVGRSTQNINENGRSQDYGTLTSYLTETKNRVSRSDQIFESIWKKANAKKY